MDKRMFLTVWCLLFAEKKKKRGRRGAVVLLPFFDFWLVINTNN
jgi:hypothetical protein